MKAETTAQPTDESEAAASSARKAEELKQLMVRYQGADAEAAGELVTRLSPMLARFLAGPVYTRAFTEDMLQECWLRIHRSRAAYRPGTPVLPWVYAIARHTRIDSYDAEEKIDARETALEQISDTDGRRLFRRRHPNLTFGSWLAPAGQAARSHSHAQGFRVDTRGNRPGHGLDGRRR